MIEPMMQFLTINNRFLNVKALIGALCEGSFPALVNGVATLGPPSNRAAAQM